MNGVEAFLQKFSNIGDMILKQQRQNITRQYGAEVLNTMNRVSSIRNLLYRQRPAKLRDIFVYPTLNHEKSSFTSDDVFKDFLNGNRIVIRGSAGLGKSVLLKHFCLQHIENDLRVIPLFVELRRINPSETKTLLDSIHFMYSSEYSLPKTDLERGLLAGEFSLLLDGFDEVASSNKLSIEAQILDFSNRYPGCPVMVSGRRDETLQSWDNFLIFDIAPMTPALTEEMINKLDVDPDLKKNFIENAIPRLFKRKDSSFIQTPLLAILMLLTFEMHADVPNQMHLFYANAFETLMHGHDATKSQFRRSLNCGLTEQNFKKLFASFCATTYSKHKFEFNAGEMMDFVKSSSTTISSEFDHRKFVEDLVLNVCVMQYESLEYSFVHRSFQEYFTALYLKDAPFRVVQKFLDSGFHPIKENVLPMLFGMDADRIEKEWVYPNLEKIMTLLGDGTSDDRANRLIDQIWIEYRFGFSGELDTFFAPQSEYNQFIYTIESLYLEESPTWADNWQSGAARAKNLWRLWEEGKIPKDGITIVHDQNSSLQSLPFEKEFYGEMAVTASKVSFNERKFSGLLGAANQFVEALDGIWLQVKQRVENNDKFALELF
jgi:predicted NACHT family NTPase